MAFPFASFSRRKIHQRAKVSGRLRPDATFAQVLQPKCRWKKVQEPRSLPPPPQRFLRAGGPACVFLRARRCWVTPTAPRSGSSSGQEGRRARIPPRSRSLPAPPLPLQTAACRREPPAKKARGGRRRGDMRLSLPGRWAGAARGAFSSSSPPPVPRLDCLACPGAAVNATQARRNRRRRRRGAPSRSEMQAAPVRAGGLRECRRRLVR